MAPLPTSAAEASHDRSQPETADWWARVSPRVVHVANRLGRIGQKPSFAIEDNPDQVLEWNQIFIDTLIATSTANSSSQRLGAIVHTAIFDAYNGIERRYTPCSFRRKPPTAHRGGPLW